MLERWRGGREEKEGGGGYRKNSDENGITPHMQDNTPGTVFTPFCNFTVQFISISIPCTDPNWYGPNKGCWVFVCIEFGYGNCSYT